MKIAKDDRNFFQKLWCKWFHVDERFIDTKGETNHHAISWGHKCFKKSIFIKKIWIENEFGKRI